MDTGQVHVFVQVVGIRFTGRGFRVKEPKTVAELLDAAQDGQEFGVVLQGLFGALEKAIDDDE